MELRGETLKYLVREGSRCSYSIYSIPMELQCTKVRENYLARGEHNLPIMIINSLQHELHVYPSSVRNSNIDSFFFSITTAKLLGKTICLRCPPLISIFNFNQDKTLDTSDLYFWNLQVNSFPTRYYTS